VAHGARLVSAGKSRYICLQMKRSRQANAFLLIASQRLAGLLLRPGR
jgi:hypothetical protein